METRVAILEKELSQVSGLFDRLDITIEKLSDVSNSIKQLLAVHETKLAQHEQTHKDLSNELEKRRIETAAQYAGIQEKFSSVQNIFKTEIDSVEKKITDQLNALKTGQDDINKSLTEKTNSFSSWKSLLIGAGLVIFWLIDKTHFFGLLP